MGHTHYWSFNKIAKGKTQQTEKVYQKAILECTKIVKYYSGEFGGLSGFTAHAQIGLYKGLNVNGSERVGQCEDFIMRERYKLNQGSDFCKTNMYPYDTVVTACLIVLKHRLGDLFDVSSDGRQDDWNDGLILAKKVLGLKSLTIPDSIKPNVKYEVEMWK